jgi:hypothetical protein
VQLRKLVLAKDTPLRSELSLRSKGPKKGSAFHVADVVQQVLSSKIAAVDQKSADDASRVTVASEASLRKTLCTEANLVCLDVIEDIAKILHNKLMDKDRLLMNVMWSVFLTFLSTRQSARFLGHCFASVRSFSHKFRKAFFSSSSKYCEELCAELVRLCNFVNTSIRSQATATLYVLAKV